MASFVSATDVALAQAMRNGTLSVQLRTGRMGDYIAFSDAVGVIEVHLSRPEALARLAAIQAALSA